MPDTVGRQNNPAPSQHAIEALHLATAYQASRALQVAIRLGLVDLIAGEPQSAQELAPQTETHAASLRRLLRTLAAYGVFLEQSDGRFALGPLGSVLRTGTPGSVRDLALMWGDDDYWVTWAELERCVRTGRTASEHLFGAKDAFQRYAANPRFAPIFNAGMTASSATTAAAVLANYDFSTVKSVTDVGGGQGHLIAAILKANSALRGTLIDLPSVIEKAPHLLAQAGVIDRCEVLGGDMFAKVNEGSDLYILSRVIDSFDDDRAVSVLINCRRAMGKTARLLLIEPVLPDKIEAPAPLDLQANMLMDLNMLVRTGGCERTQSEYRTFLAAADLQLKRIIPTEASVSLIEAEPA